MMFYSEESCENQIDTNLLAYTHADLLSPI